MTMFDNNPMISWLIASLKVVRYFAPFLLLIGVPISDYLLEHVWPKTKPKLHQRTSWAKYATLILGGGLTVCALIYDDQERTNQHAASEHASIAQQAKIDQMTTTIGQLLLTLANKPEFDIVTRTQILEERKKFQIGETTASSLNILASQWSNKRAQAKLDNETERHNAAEQAKQFLTTSFPIWNYAVTTFQTKLVLMTYKISASVNSDYTGLPSEEFLLRDMNIGWNEHSVDVCEINLGTNFPWKCKCTIRIPDSMSGGRPPQLQFQCQGTGDNGSGVLLITLRPGNLVEAYQTVSGDKPFVDTCSMSNYNECINSALDSLIGSQAEQFLPKAK